MKSESSQHFASSSTCDAQGSAVEILDHPLSFQRYFQESCSQCAADMRPPLAPIEASAREAAAQRTNYFYVDAKRLERPGPSRGEVVCTLASFGSR